MINEKEQGSGKELRKHIQKRRTEGENERKRNDSNKNKSKSRMN